MHNDTLTKTLTSGAAVFGILAGLSIIPLQAQALDFNPPAWRGQPLTTFQEWKFTTNPPAPLFPIEQKNFCVNYDTKKTEARPGTGLNGSGTFWQSSGDNATITFGIANCIDEEARKDMWVQVTVADGDKIAIGSTGAVDPKTPITITLPSITQIINPPGFDDTKYDFYLVEWQIFPNPDYETFDLILPKNGTKLYEVVVDTISTPEPTSTLSLLALGTLGAASTLKRKLKPKSSEKDTTKVS